MNTQDLYKSVTDEWHEEFPYATVSSALRA